MEEEKEVIEVKPEPVEEEKKEEAPVEKKETYAFPTKILVAFILCVVGAGFAVAWSFAAFFAVPLGIVALCLFKNQSDERRPWYYFLKIGKIVAIVEIPVGALMGTIWTIVQIVNAIQAAVNA